MINKRLFLLTGLMTGIVCISSCAQPTNVGVQTPTVGAQPTNVVSNPVRPAQKFFGVNKGKLGDPAPALTVKEWIKGRPVKIQPGTNIYVVIFAPLTRAGDFALDNFSSLQKMYQDRGLITIAISDEAPEQLQDFVRAKGAAINFTVAADDIPGRTAKTYAMIFNQHQIPRAYVIGKDGKVLWFGHPLRSGMGYVVDDVVSGRYDMAKTKQKIAAMEQMELYLAMAREGDTNFFMVGRKLMAIRQNDAPALCELASKIATDPYMVQRDYALANAALDRAEQISATNATDIAVDRAILLFQSGKEEEGLAKAKQALVSAKNKDAKDEVQICIQAMESHIAAGKTNQIKAPASKP